MFDLILLVTLAHNDNEPDPRGQITTINENRVLFEFQENVDHISANSLHFTVCV